MTCIYFAIFSLIAVNANPAIIQTKHGAVRGTTSVARNGNKFNIFYGIPYAKEPTGDLRFQPPVSIEKWSGILDATKTPPICPQVLEGTTNFSGIEDCLYVNVYTPQNATAGSNIPTIVHLFGGQFKYGYPSLQGPEFFMSRDIIVVVVSYRLGVLGLLSTGDSVIPGNMALKDQVLALQWTKENIYEFGGDPNRITLNGHSSGAVCAHLHTLSPMSKGLFNRVIIQSGLATSPSFFIDRDTAIGLTRELARKVNCDFKSSTKLLSCFKAIGTEKLVRLGEELKVWPHEPSYGFRPTVEDENSGNAFLTRIPISAPYQSTKPNWLVGMTSGEGSTLVSSIFSDPKEYHDVTTYRPALIIPILTGFLWSSRPAHINYIAQTVTTHFFGNDRISSNGDNALVDLLTGAYQGLSILNEVQKYEGMKFLYLYDHRANWSNQDARYGKSLDYLDSQKLPGVAHADEMPLIFKKDPLRDEDYMLGDEIITRWVNFAYSGNPNKPFPINTSIFGPWDPITTPRLEFLRIKWNGSMETDYYKTKYNFWNKLPIFSKYR